MALLGHFGVEWDLLAATPAERAELAAWIATYRRLRHLVGTGVVVRGDHPDPGLVVNGLVSSDRLEAWYVVAQIASSQTTSPLPVLLPGLDPDRHYRITAEGPRDPAVGGADLSDSWLDDGGVTLPGRALLSTGLQLPVLLPESARVLRVEAVSGW